MVTAMSPRAAPKTARTRRRRPIQLAALRGFEASARQLSITHAADELALTQSSISRQIATLESQVGQPLFVRKTRSLALTPEGRRLHGVAAQALAAIDRCVDEIRGFDQPPPGRHPDSGTGILLAECWEFSASARRRVRATLERDAARKRENQNRPFMPIVTVTKFVMLWRKRSFVPM